MLPPTRPPFDPEQYGKLQDVVMQEYAAIRREIDVTLANQVAILSFGAATVGLLVAAAGTLWQSEPLLSALLLLFVVPAACFLALAVHAGELVRLMRAGLFLHELENWVNSAWGSVLEAGRPVLAWEQWTIREGRADVDRHNQLAITAVFSLLAFGFVGAGFWRLHKGPYFSWLAVPLLVVSLLIGLVTVVWVWWLRRSAYSYRRAYRSNGSAGVSA